MNRLHFDSNNLSPTHENLGIALAFGNYNKDVENWIK
jgi:hypothetical protein